MHARNAVLPVESSPLFLAHDTDHHFSNDNLEVYPLHASLTEPTITAKLRVTSGIPAQVWTLARRSHRRVLQMFTPRQHTDDRGTLADRMCGEGDGEYYGFPAADCSACISPALRIYRRSLIAIMICKCHVPDIDH